MPKQLTPQIVLTHFDWSLARLKEAIEKEDTEYYRGATLQRFGLTYDTALKTIRAFAKEQDHTCTDDESCFLWVEEKQWLKKGTDWNVILVDYQRIQRQPEGEEADKIYDQLKTYYILFSHLSECMKLAGR